MTSVYAIKQISGHPVKTACMFSGAFVRMTFGSRGVVILLVMSSSWVKHGKLRIGACADV